MAGRGENPSGVGRGKRSFELLCLITAKTRPKVISRGEDDVVRDEAVFKTSYGRFIDVAGREKKSERRRTRKKVLNCSKFLYRGQPWVAHVVKTCNTREAHV